MSNFVVRDICKSDTSRVLELMRELAVFEGYSDNFAVTEQTIEQGCFVTGAFNVLVADVRGSVQGILVCFHQPFTYDLTPWLIIKEFYIADEYRRSGLGKELFKEAWRRCQEAGGLKMKWEVLSSNTRAQAFYGSLGAVLEDEWIIMSKTASSRDTHNHRGRPAPADISASSSKMDQKRANPGE